MKITINKGDPHPIDHRDAPDGYHAAPELDLDKPCRGCAFLRDGPECEQVCPRCCGEERADGQHVIFIKDNAVRIPKLEMRRDDPCTGTVYVVDENGRPLAMFRILQPQGHLPGGEEVMDAVENFNQAQKLIAHLTTLWAKP